MHFECETPSGAEEWKAKTNTAKNSRKIRAPNAPLPHALIMIRAKLRGTQITKYVYANNAKKTGI